MSVKYLYLDDEQEQQTKSIAELLVSEDDELTIDLDTPKTFGEEIARLKKGEYDGLIFDLRLDVKSAAEYRAFTLAQELRTRATEGSIKDIPIVVCSTDIKLKKSYDKDGTGHDLFDRKYLKDEDLVERSEIISKELVALAKGYKQITSIKSQKGGAGAQLKKLFILSTEELEPLDIRLIDYFGEIEGRLPTHEYARFLMRELLLTPGPLVDENILAARMGVNSDCDGFKELVNNKFKEFRYKGPFHEHWSRWWWHLIDLWWRENCKSNISQLNAVERVDSLAKSTKIKNLISAKPIQSGYGTKYWTIDALYQKPLDITDGVQIESKDEPYPWQESIYMSIKASLDIESRSNNLFPHQLEKERIKDLKKELEE